LTKSVLTNKFGRGFSPLWKGLNLSLTIRYIVYFPLISYDMHNMSEIERFAIELLDQRELLLADHLSIVLGDDKWDAGPLVEEILPVYWEKVGDRLQNCFPGNIYRPLNYVHAWSARGGFKDSTRAYMDVISSHIEGCLQSLLKIPTEGRAMSRAFGPAVVQLKRQKIISAELANKLWRFNQIINVPAKHFGAYAPTNWLDERTFSVIETVYAIIIMRNLSIQLFSLLKTNGVSLPHEWPEFRDGWLTDFREYKMEP
jgi:hypothetical protein